MTDTKTLLVIDGSHLAYKAFFAVQHFKAKSLAASNLSELQIMQRVTEETGRTLVGMVSKILNAHKPTHALIAFDDNRASDTFRAKLLPSYKAHREPKQLHHDSFVIFKKLMGSLGVNTWTVPEGYEADDLIGSVVSQFAPEFDKVYLHSGDKDFWQLVSNQVTVLTPQGRKSGRELHITPSVVIAEMGVRPDQVIAYKALAGDSSDGYRGVNKIGDKTARSLLNKYDSLDSIIERSPEIKGILGKRLTEGQDDARKCETLARIVTDLELGFNSEHMVINPNPAVLKRQLAGLRKMCQANIRKL